MIPETGFLGMMLGATLGVQVVLALLAVMSLMSWTIIFHKLILYRRTRRQVTQGYALFNDAQDLSEGLQAV
ncbi:MAG: protein TolQ, partial [Humidesulfovibrio sp.]|nr:protein TolQ [Humidesulfovibrio sp.]